MIHYNPARRMTTLLLTGVATALLLGGCSNTNQMSMPGITGSLGKYIGGSSDNKLTAERLGTRPEPKQSQLLENTTRLAEAFRADPANGDVAIQYVYSLRALGLQQQAVSVLATAYRHNPEHPVVASEYGRLLLGTGKEVQARKVLTQANSEQTDWHTLSALGTIEARDGHYDKATEYFQKAQKLAPQSPSVINNLALALALDGKPEEAENLLRNADDSGRFGPRLRQNLALVLALQGKFDDARAVATTDLPAKEAEANIAYLKRMLSTTDVAHGVEFSDETTLPGQGVAAADDGPTTTGALPSKPAAADDDGKPMLIDPTSVHHLQ